MDEPPIVELRYGAAVTLYASSKELDGVRFAHQFFIARGCYGVHIMATPYTLDNHPQGSFICTLTAALERIIEARSILVKPQPKSGGRIGGIEI